MNFNYLFKFLFFTFLLHSAKAQHIIYVNHNASGANDGSTWNNAFTNLSEAIKSAEEGTHIWVANGTYTPVSPDTTFKIEKSIQLVGGFSGNETKMQQRDLENSSTILSGETGTVNDDDNLSVILWADHLKDSLILDGFTFEKTRIRQGNYYFAGISLHSTKTRIQNCVFENKMTPILASTHIYADSLGIVIRNSKFINNVSNYSGLIHTLRNDLTIENSLFENNVNEGFGIINYDGTGSVLKVRNSVFRKNNKADIHINAAYALFDSCIFENHEMPRTYLIYVSGADSIVINNSSFLNNNNGNPLVYTKDATIRNTIFRNGNDNAIYQSGGTLNTYNCIFDNFKGGSGGAIYCNYGKFNDTKFINNVSGMGGAVYAQNLKATNSIFENNKSGYAGALYSANIFDILNCTFRNNVSDSQGGAFFGSKGGVKGSRFENNFAKYTGGAAVTFDSSVFQSSVFINNGTPDTSASAPSSSGGAIYCGGQTWVHNSVFIKNSAYNGAALQAGGATVISNSTFFNNTSPVDSNNGAFSHVNDIEIVSSIFWNPGIQELYTNYTNTETVSYSIFKDIKTGEGNLNRAPLLNDDGIPQSGSISIDHGIILPIYKLGNTDAYGNPRVSGKSIDIGAVEFQEIITSTENNLEKNNLVVYPNPVMKGELLKLNPKENMEWQTMEIYNQIGHKVMHMSNTGKNSEIEVEIQISGTYFIILIGDNGLTYKSKLVVE